MYLENLRLFHFRNFLHEEIEWSSGLNFIVGRNGQGKTNLVEAIHFLSLMRSFRTTVIRELTCWSEKSSSVFGKVQRKHTSFDLGVSVEGAVKCPYVQGEKVRSVTDYLGKLVCVGFTPTDLALVKGAPQLRRRFLDKHLVELHPPLMRHMMGYQRALRSKNKILKGDSVDRAELETWNTLIAEEAVPIIRARREFLDQLEELGNEFHKEFSPADGKLELNARSALLDENGETSCEYVLEKLSEQFDREILYKTALVGPHRDDMQIKFGGVEARAYASQGQARSIVLSLTLAVIALLEREHDDSPVILLDDVESELDGERREKFLQVILEQGRQVFITGTELPKDPFLRGSETRVVEIIDGRIEGENNLAVGV